MIIYCLYLLVFLSLIYANGFFSLFKDGQINSKKLSIFFLGKALAVPVFLFIYNKFYGGIDNLDTGKFFHDVKVISDYGKNDPAFLMRLLFGFQNDSPGSTDYENVLKYTLNWDNGTAKDYFYNDNRVVIRLHVILNFITFGIYPVHALISCFLSFTGLFFIYKTFKEWFKGKETWMLLILCFFPSFWFYTGALLKEGITIFIMGCTVYQLKQFFTGTFKLPGLIWFLFLVYCSILLKPYLLSFSLLYFGLFFFIIFSRKIKHKLVLFFSTLLVCIFTMNFVSIILKNRSLPEAVAIQQHRFIGVSRGGIFLSDGENFVRLSNDTSQIKRKKVNGTSCTIRKDVSYMYWKTEDQKDTLYCRSNQDTNKVYKLEYIIQPGNSNVELPASNTISIVAACFYYTLFYPSFYNTKNALQLLASFENVCIAAALLIFVFGLFKNKKHKLLPVAFVGFALFLCLLIGLTAPNSGAIFRYRSPAIIFLLLAALYYADLRSLISKSPQR